MPSIQTSNKLIAKNTIFLYFRMFFVMLITIYTSRVILNTLGVSDYGVYNVVAGFVSLFGFLNSTLTASVQRFYNYELGKGDYCGVSAVYTIGLISSVIICVLLLLILESLGLWYIKNIMVIPVGRMDAAIITFQASVVTMVFTVMQIPYVGATLAYEKMDFYAIISVVDVVLKLCAVFALRLFAFDKLVLFALSYALISLLIFLIYVLYTKIKLTTIKFRVPINARTFSQLLSFSGWNLLGTFAFIINGQGTNLLLNVFFGPIVNAARAISFQVSSAVGSFTQSITMAFRPQVVESYAKGDNARVLQLFYFQSKIGLLLTTLLIVPIILEIEIILKIWLGSSIPEYTAIFTILVLLVQYISVINPSIVQVAFATGSIKRFQIASSIVNISLVPLAWLFLKLNYNPVSVFLLSILVSIINQYVCLVQLRKVYDYDLRNYIYKVIIPCFVVFLIAFMLMAPISYLLTQSILRLFVILLLDIIIVPLLVYFIALSKEQKSYLLEIVGKTLKRNGCTKINNTH